MYELILVISVGCTVTHLLCCKDALGKPQKWRVLKEHTPRLAVGGDPSTSWILLFPNISGDLEKNTYRVFRHIFRRLAKIFLFHYCDKYVRNRTLHVIDKSFWFVKIIMFIIRLLCRKRIVSLSTAIESVRVYGSVGIMRLTL